MKKIIYAATLVSFTVVSLGSPYVAAAAYTFNQPATTGISLTPTLVSDNQNPVISNGYSIQISSAGTSTTWQKGFDQTVTVTASDNVKNLFTNSSSGLFSSGGKLGIALYLVPVSGTAGQSNISYTYATSAPSFTSFDTKKESSTILLHNPSNALYVPVPVKSGYFIGYLETKANKKNLDVSGQFTDTIASLNISEVPLGSYNLYAAVGVASISSGSSTDYSPFQIFLPNTIKQPAYSTTLEPLPQSVSRNIDFTLNSRNDSKKHSYATEYDTALSAMFSSSISITAAPKPTILITSPDQGDVWQRDGKNQVTWITNFKRSNHNNTGLDINKGIEIVPPYGYNFLHRHSTTNQSLNTAEIAGISLALQFVPVVGQIIGAVLQILSFAGVFSSDEKPFAVPVHITLVPTAETLAACNAAAVTSNKKNPCPDSYNLGSNYLENAKINVGAGKIDSLTSGTYQVVISAKWNSNPAIVATSSVFTIVHKASSIDSVSISAVTSGGTQVKVVGSGFSTSTNSIIFSTKGTDSLVTVVAPSPDTQMITSTIPSSLLDLTKNYTVTVINEFGTTTPFRLNLGKTSTKPGTTTSTSTSVITSHPATTTPSTASTTNGQALIPATLSYSCPQGATLSNQNCTATVISTSTKSVNPTITYTCPANTIESTSKTNKCSQTASSTVLVDKTKVSTCPANTVANDKNTKCFELISSIKVTPATPTYACAANFTLNAVAHNCSPVVVPTQSANAWTAFTTWFSSFF